MPELVPPATKNQFKAFVDAVEAGPDYAQPAAYALGLATVEGEGADTRILDVHFTRRNYGTHPGTAAVLAVALEQESGLMTGEHLLTEAQLAACKSMFLPFDGEKGHANRDTLALMHQVAYRDALTVYRRHPLDEPLAATRRLPVLGVVRDWEDDPGSVGDLFTRLYALSDRARLPNTVNIVPPRDFGLLPNIVITEDHGTFSVERWNELEEAMVFQGLSRHVRILDKFPRMLDHVVPTGVRIADPSRVRLGAFVGVGTTVMPEGAINFNAGTLGEAMVEGRISQGVVVGHHSDVGGGASTQGTMSGGGKEKISIGEHTLLEANSGVGISLGDHCRVEAGFYIKSTTPIRVNDGSLLGVEDGTFVKAEQLSGRDNMLIRRNAKDGVVEVVPNKGDEWGGLNAALHAN